MAQEIKCLLYNHEDLSLDPQDPRKSKSESTTLHRGREITGDHWPGNTEMVGSRFSEKAHPKKPRK